MSSRRRFISGSLGTVALGGALPGFLREAASAQTLPAAATDPRNVLVVVQLAGGNDGLNTIVPYSDDAYHRVRPALRVAANSVLKIDDRVGFNPVLLGLNELYKSGQVAIVHGVGYPNPNRSHFEATQIWETASPVRPQQYGWLGRYLDRRYPQGTKPPSPFETVALGDTLPAALVSSHVDVPAIENDERRVSFEIGKGGVDGDSAGFAGSEGDVVVRVKDGEHAIAGGFAAELEVGHEGDGFARIGQGDGEAEARTRLVCIGPGGGIVVAGNGGAERNGGKHVERGEVVRLLRVGFPVEVAGENLAL